MASAPMVRTYNLGGQQLESVPCTLDLGVTMANDLSWSRYIEIIVSKANKTLGLVKKCAETSKTSTPGSSFPAPLTCRP